LYFKNKSKTRLFVGLCIGIILILIVVVIPVYFSGKNSSRSTSSKKNLIFLISDGCGPASFTFARTLAQMPLNLDAHLVGTIQTKSANSLVTDSAASATAYACALKTNNDAIAVDAKEKPCGTILEAAQSIGMKTGNYC
jgi:alkaline phosphatase